MDEANVILVMLRRPQLDKPDEARSDPFWEFGSFGCTGCHRWNLMNPKRLEELNGVCLAFAQNGPLGVKLVHVTPPVRVRRHGMLGEATWSPMEMPLTYASAPTLVSNFGFSDVPELLDFTGDVRRSSLTAKFASRFRSRRLPLPASIGRTVREVYERTRSERGIVADTYVDALPWPPPRLDTNREATYRRCLRVNATLGVRRACVPIKTRWSPG